MKFSYSNVSTFSSCPYKWKLHYKDKLRTLPETNAENALYLGLAIHKGIEEGSVEAALDEYKSHYNMLTDENYNYMIQIEHQIPKVLEILPPGGEHELKIDTDEYIGFVDYVCGDTLFDFKFSNNIENYVRSPQLSIYKYYLEQVRPDIKINHLKYIFVPKVNIRQKMKAKPPESIHEFRDRLQTELDASEIRVVEVDYDPEAVKSFRECCDFLETCDEFPKNPTKLCDWCNFKEYCESNGKIHWKITNDYWEDIMLLPKNEKKDLKKEVLTELPSIYMYADSYVGKSTFFDSMDNVLFLNTDGNFDMYSNPSIYIAKTTKMNGRIKVDTSAWDNFLEVIEELEKKENTFKHIVLDLVEDFREHCRVYMCDKLKIAHESDSNYSKAWDMVTTEFNQAIKRLKSAGYTVHYISKELTKEVTPKGGLPYTQYRPNIQEKTAGVLSGTVKLTCRAYVDERGERWVNLKPSPHEAGGGRFLFKVDKCKLDKNELLKAINEADLKPVNK